jgi:hypothetical protein
LDFIRDLQKPQDMKPGTFLQYIRIQNSMVQDSCTILFSR